MKELSNSLRIACVATGTAGVALVGAGCHTGQSESEKAKAREDFQEAWAHRTPEEASHPKSMVVAQGRAPLVYQAPADCTVHIYDTTTGNEIATAAAKNDGLIYVSEQTGAFVNGKRVVPGPLAPGHRYSISVDTPHDEDWDSYVRRQAPPPASQPQQR